MGIPDGSLPLTQEDRMQTIDAKKGAFYSGYAAMHVRPEIEDEIERRFDKKTLLVAHEGHFIGTRPFGGGRALQWPSFNAKGYTEYPYEQIALLEEKTLHVALVVTGVPEMCKSFVVPAPFDKWKVGSEVLPDNPHAKRNKEAA
jgi:hypothetical protein